jgi:tetratricopeptide (TPR) repeat protein
MIQLYRGKFDDAIKYLIETYKSDPKDPVVLYNLSLAYTKKKDFKTALDMINKCLILNPNYLAANELKSRLLSELKN